MVDFWEGRFDVLVCTTIVESGIDLPSVNTLIVDRAERLGLGQLHQLRGRVGRSGQRAYAYLFHPADQVLSETPTSGCARSATTPRSGAGFKIAMRDLEIRGAGNLLGHDQSGPVAAVGYDLYVQLVAEAVADAKGFVVPEVVQVNLDVPGEAHLPKSYVEADDARLEAYRRLVGVASMAELQDLRDEWLDRYGPLPAPAQGLLELGELRLECLALGVRSVVVLARARRHPHQARREDRSARTLAQPADAGAPHARFAGLRRGDQGVALRGLERGCDAARAARDAAFPGRGGRRGQRLIR